MNILFLLPVVSSALIKASSMLIVLYFSSRMNAEDFGAFSYGFSFIVTLATFFSSVVGQTWAKLDVLGKKKKVMLPVFLSVIFIGGVSSLVMTNIAGYSSLVSLLIALAVFLSFLSYTAQFIIVYYGFYKIALVAALAAFLSVIFGVILNYNDFYKAEQAGVIFLLIVFYFIQILCCSLSIGTTKKGENVSWSVVVKLVMKYSGISLMGAPVHFVCLTMLAGFSGAVAVGDFNLSFQLYIASAFIITSLQPVLMRMFVKSDYYFLVKMCVLSVFICLMMALMYYLSTYLFECQSSSIFCLNSTVIFLTFCAAMVAGLNSVLLQFINANKDPYINMKLQAVFALFYMLLAWIFLSAELGLIGLYLSIIISSLLLFMMQIYSIKGVSDEDRSSNC